MLARRKCGAGAGAGRCSTGAGLAWNSAADAGLAPALDVALVGGDGGERAMAMAMRRVR